MLDTDTKRRIDTARDILVGKVPDPKSQVEQITIALIYKFMDDMDAESEEFGGVRKFFAGDFARYGWAKLMRSGLGGHETLNLYAEAIAKMPENPGIPLLFRDIFKNAYLPYRDPETLRAFLKIIDEFNYDHSERLGDAFEYLLSVLGSQGDAGQFRTPRHIIDFMVAIVDPKKNETVLDPACGTAGFLISAYKHILKKNQINIDGQDKQDKETGNNGAGLALRTTLTPEEKGRLAQNFTGYDISPDMVRLSLVNMYLHGFADPHIYEYDTLTSQERWNEYADVIFANPPFMSPKGGIQPHNRFSVQSKRSEVLFVDYIAEHLTPNGRAAVIVPEGVIFQSGTAYKRLRKMLVEEFLVAVVSLPAGVFNPYSGVKTSILILDKALAKKSKTIGFFKVENDGFGLGAQRREIDINDIPQAQTEIKNYISHINSSESTVDLNTKIRLIIPKEKIARSGEFNLSGERYQESFISTSNWPLVKLSDICEFRGGLWKGEREPLRLVKILRNTNFTKDGHLRLDDVAEHHVEERQLESRQLIYGDILLEKSGGGPTQPVGRVALFNYKEAGYSFSNFTTRIRVNDPRIDSIYLWHCLNYLYLSGQTEKIQKRTSGIRNLDNSAYQAFQIPLPPLAVQQVIVAEIEGYQKVIDGARAVIDNYRPHIPIDPEWPIVDLDTLCTDILSGGTPSTTNETYWNGEIPWMTSADIVDYKNINIRKYITNDGLNNSATNLIPKGNIIVVTRVGLGKLVLNDFDVCISQDSQGLILKNELVIPEFLLYVLAKIVQVFKETSQGTTIQGVTKQTLKSLKIPLPSINTQKAIVAEIEAERSMVKANSELITRMEKKIQAALARVWGVEPAKPSDLGNLENSSQESYQIVLPSETYQVAEDNGTYSTQSPDEEIQKE